MSKTQTPGLTFAAFREDTLARLHGACASAVSPAFQEQQADGVLAALESFGVLEVRYARYCDERWRARG